MGNKLQGLVRRGNKLSVRRRVPDEIRHIIGRKEIWKSLGTGDLQLAKELYWKISGEIESEFTRARQSLDPTELKPLTKLMAQRFAKDWYLKKIKMDVDDVLSNLRSIVVEDFLIDLDRYQELLISGTDEEIMSTLQACSDKILIENEYPFSQKVFSNGKKHHLKTALVDKFSDGYWELIKIVRRGELENVKRQKSALTGEGGCQFFDDMFATVAAKVDQIGLIATSKITLDDAIEKFISVGQKSSREILNSRVSFRFLQEVVGGEILISNITRDHFYEVFKTVSSFPPNAIKKKINKGKALNEIAHEAKARNSETLHPTTINKYMCQISELMQWAVDDGLIEKNLANGKFLRASKKDIETGKDARNPFSIKQLKKIFSDTVFYSPSVSNPTFYWVPLIALYTGMRMEEILQLTQNDVKKIDGVTVFRLHDEGKNTLKNKTARRDVPWHPKFHELGLMSLVNAAEKNDDSQLFPDISRGASGRFSKIFSQQYSRYLKKIGAKTEKTSFHSFRHNFRDACRSSEISDAIACEIAGWKYGSGTHTLYGSKMEIAKLVEAIHLVEYPEICFDKIKVIKWV